MKLLSLLVLLFSISAHAAKTEVISLKISRQFHEGSKTFLKEDGKEINFFMNIDKDGTGYASYQQFTQAKSGKLLANHEIRISKEVDTEKLCANGFIYIIDLGGEVSSAGLVTSTQKSFCGPEIQFVKNHFSANHLSHLDGDHWNFSMRAEILSGKITSL